MLNKAITATALAAALLCGGATTATGLHKDVSLSIDGQLVPAAGFALTVADVLSAKGITVTDQDVVTPALDAPLTDGRTIAIQFSKQLTLNVDGTPHTLRTTAATLDAALATSAIAEIESSRLSLPTTSPLPRDGLTVDVSTPKEVQLSVGGKKSEVTTTAASVADVLAEQGITAAATDKLTPAADDSVTEGQKIVLDRVKITKKTKTEALSYSTVKKTSSSLWKGESRVVTAGSKGKAKRTYEITEVNGKVTSKRVVSEVVVTKPTSRVLTVGTKASASGVGINLARASLWDRIARCESGGNWKINTGNGYYGGLQFNLASWRSNGGRDFAPYPHQASRAEQITVANRYYAKAGTAPWSCA